MTTTLDHPAPPPAEHRVTREDALKFMARGHTAASLLAHAANPGTIRTLAEGAGLTPQEARNLVFTTSLAVGRLEAEDMTPEKCWDALGWDLAFVEEMLAPPAPAAVPAQRPPAGPVRTVLAVTLALAAVPALLLLQRADGWVSHRSCSSCAPCSGNCGCGCHSRNAEAA